MREPDGPIDEDAARRNTRRLFTVLCGCLVFLFVLGTIALALGLTRSSGHRRSNAISASLALFVILIVVAVGVALSYRLCTRPSAQRVQQYSWGRRRRVMSALQRGSSLDAQDFPVAEALMYSNRNWRRLLWFFPLVALLAAIDAVFQHGAHRALAVVWVFCFLLFIPLLIRQQRRLWRNYDRMVRAEEPPAPTD